MPGKLSASKQKSSMSVTDMTSMSQLLKTLFGGVCDSRVNFDSVMFDELGVWIPDRVKFYCVIQFLICCLMTSSLISFDGSFVCDSCCCLFLYFFLIFWTHRLMEHTPTCHQSSEQLKTTSRGNFWLCQTCVTYLFCELPLQQAVVALIPATIIIISMSGVTQLPVRLRCCRSCPGRV